MELIRKTSERSAYDSGVQSYAEVVLDECFHRKRISWRIGKTLVHSVLLEKCLAGYSVCLPKYDFSTKHFLDLSKGVFCTYFSGTSGSWSIPFHKTNKKTNYVFIKASDLLMQYTLYCKRNHWNYLILYL